MTVQSDPTVAPRAAGDGLQMSWRLPGGILLGALVYLLSWQVDQAPTAVALAVLGALPLLLTLQWLWRERRAALWVLAPYVFMQCVTAAAAVMIETGSYVLELDTWGYANGASARLCTEVALLFAVAGWAAGRMPAMAPETATSRGSRRADMAFFALVATTLVLPLVNLLRLGVPLLSGLDRVAFSQIAGPMHVRMIILFLAAVPSLAMLSLNTTIPLVRKGTAALIFIGLLVMALSGEKFTGLMLTLYAASLPALIYRRTRVLKRLGLATIGALVVSSGLIFYHYSVLYQIVNVGDFVVGRIASQAEVPWAIDNIARKRDCVRTDELIVQELIPDNSRDQGIQRLMVEVAPLSFVTPFLETGSRFTMGFPAVLTFHLGMAGILAIIPIAALVGLFVRLLLFCIAGKRLLALWMGVNLFGFGAMFDQVLVAGNLYQLFYSEPTRFVWLLLLLSALAWPFKNQFRR